MASHLAVVSSAASNLWSAHELVGARHSQDTRGPVDKQPPSTDLIQDAQTLLRETQQAGGSLTGKDRLKAISTTYARLSQQLLADTKAIKSASPLQDDPDTTWTCCKLCDHTADTLKAATAGYGYNLAAIMSEPESDINVLLETYQKEASGVSLIRADEIAQVTAALKANLGVVTEAPKREKHTRKKVPRSHMKNQASSADDDSDSDQAVRWKKLRRDRVSTRQRPKAPAAKPDLMSPEALLQIHKNLNSLLQISQTLPQEVALTKSLFYEAIDAREDSIHSAESGTFKWILEDHPHQELTEPMNAAREKFSSWTRTGSGVFHISGKPGSGKSTLMKFLRSHSQTSADLSHWAGNKRLVFSSFYFWLAGSQMQRELEGLSRTILISVSQNIPDLMPLLFPNQWKLNAGHVADRKLEKLLDTEEIQEAFERLLNVDHFADHKLCVFVDGLDELLSDISFRAIAEKLKSWAELNNDVKLCVSARPYQEFLDVFDASQRLHLHELTSRDVEAFARGKFNACGSPVLSGNSGQQVVHGVRQRSEGVFVWASIAVRALTELAINQNADLETILRTLAGYDSDLDALYDHLLASLEGDDHIRSERVLLLAAQNPFSLPLNALWLGWIDDLDNVKFPPVGRPYTSAEIEARHLAVRNELSRLCKGLLDMHSDRCERKDGDQFYRQRVQWFHRTARDYIQTSSRLQRLYETTDPDHLPDAFSCLRLAEIVLAGKYRINKGSDPRRRRIYFSLLRSMFSLRASNGERHQHKRRYLEQLSKDIQMTQDDRYGGCYIVSSYKSVSHMDVVDEDAEQSGSFLHFTASYGQHEFVLADLQETSDTMKAQPDDLDVVLSAALGTHRWPTEDFRTLVHATPPRTIRLRPSFESDPLASKSEFHSSLLVFATTIAFTCLGHANEKQHLKPPTPRKIRDSFELLQQWIDVRQGTGMDEFICLLEPRDDQTPRSGPYFSTLQEVAAVFAPVKERALIEEQSSDIDRETREWILNIPGLAAVQTQGVTAARRISGPTLRAFACTHVLLGNESIAVDSNLFFRIY